MKFKSRWRLLWNDVNYQVSWWAQQHLSLVSFFLTYSSFSNLVLDSVSSADFLLLYELDLKMFSRLCSL
jgi:hypothetical protein